MLFAVNDWVSVFQSTLPARGATQLANGGDFALLISIHAPRTGSDWKAEGKLMTTEGFQSTLPARGATKTRAAEAPSKIYFNPRSPHGERPNCHC